MASLKFKTNIRCSGCKAKVANLLNNELAIKSWDIDLNDPDRILTIEGENISEETILELVKKAGYTAVRI